MPQFIPEGAQRARPATEPGPLYTIPSGPVPPPSTPWGMFQTQREIAPGIWNITTAGHGGYWLSPDRRREMPQALRDFSTWAGAPWYEEDCDANVVVLAFPEHFSAEHVWGALDTLRYMVRTGNANWSRMDAAWRGASRSKVESIADRWFTEHRHHWRRMAASTGGGNAWIVTYERIDKSERTTRRVVPSKEFYELGAVAAELPGEAL